MSNKWRIFHRTIDEKPEFRVRSTIIEACRILHSYALKIDGIQCNVTWYGYPLDSVQALGTRGSVGSFAVGECFATYFISPQGAIS